MGMDARGDQEKTSDTPVARVAGGQKLPYMCVLGTELQSLSHLSSSNSEFLHAHSNSPADISPISFNLHLCICRLEMCWVEIETLYCDLLAFCEVENLDLLTTQLFPGWVNKANTQRFQGPAPKRDQSGLTSEDWQLLLQFHLAVRVSGFP